jgi:hypothetical protein
MSNGGFTNVVILTGLTLGTIILILVIFSLVLLFIRPASNIKTKKEFDSQLNLVKRRISDMNIPIPLPDRFVLSGIPNMYLLPAQKEKIQTKVNIETNVSSVNLITGIGSLKKIKTFTGENQEE